MSALEIGTERIAKIKSTFLGIEDHGIFTSWLDLDYGGSAQGAGTLCLDYSSDGQRIESEPGCVHRWLIGVLMACGVDQWEKVAGRTVIAICEEGWNGKVLGLKPLPTERGSEFIFATIFSHDE